MVDLEALARHVDHAAAERVLGREGDRVDEEVELAPVLGDALEDRLELAVGHHVHRHEDRRLDLAGERLDVRLRLLVEIGDRELGAERAEGAGAAPGDRAVVGDADDEALACPRAASLSRREGSCDSPAVRLAGMPTSARVWRAIISSSSVGTTRSATRLVGRRDAACAPASLAAGSSSAPSQASRSAMRARIAGEFSPMPAVKTKASRPPSAAASRPASSAAAVDEVVDREGGARDRRSRAGRACRCEMPERPFSPDVVVEEVGDLRGGHALLLDQVAARRRDRAGPGACPSAGRRAR